MCVSVHLPASKILKQRRNNRSRVEKKVDPLRLWCLQQDQARNKVVQNVEVLEEDINSKKVKIVQGEDRLTTKDVAWRGIFGTVLENGRLWHHISAEQKDIVVAACKNTTWYWFSCLVFGIGGLVTLTVMRDPLATACPEWTNRDLFAVICIIQTVLSYLSDVHWCMGGGIVYYVDVCLALCVGNIMQFEPLVFCEKADRYVALMVACGWTAALCSLWHQQYMTLIFLKDTLKNSERNGDGMCRQRLQTWMHYHGLWHLFGPMGMVCSLVYMSFCC